jgi:hypothetical protein
MHTNPPILDVKSAAAGKQNRLHSGAGSNKTSTEVRSDLSLTYLSHHQSPHITIPKNAIPRNQKTQSNYVCTVCYVDLPSICGGAAVIPLVSVSESALMSVWRGYDTLRGLRYTLPRCLRTYGRTSDRLFARPRQFVIVGYAVL